jgi:hypothetical protein
LRGSPQLLARRGGLASSSKGDMAQSLLPFQP